MSGDAVQVAAQAFDWPVTAVFVLDALMLLSACTLTVIFLKYRRELNNSGAIAGLLLILTGFWALTLFYILHLVTIAWLPQRLAETAALQNMVDYSVRYVWHTGVMFVALMTLGIVFAMRAMLNQNAALDDARQEAQAHSKQKSEFLAAMSHELRTPLNAILGFSEFMQHDVVAIDPGRVKSYAENVHGSASMLRSLIDDLLDISRIEAGRLDLDMIPVSVADIVRNAVTTLTPRAIERDVTLSVEIHADFPMIHADRRALQQICLNLITNAIKFTPDGGSVTIGLEHHETEISVAFTDTGIGISTDLLDQIFEPFVQGEEKREGADAGYGLGLRICKGLIDAHHGSISIDSVEGQGTEITVRIPKCSPTQRQSDEPTLHVVTGNGSDTTPTALAS